MVSIVYIRTETRIGDLTARGKNHKKCPVLFSSGIRYHLATCKAEGALNTFLDGVGHRSLLLLSAFPSAPLLSLPEILSLISSLGPFGLFLPPSP